jgi:CubicO group peptidase (beta-lactamase class C family)
VLIFVATSSFAQDAARMDEVVRVTVRDKTFMGAVLVARGTDVILSKGYGSANLEWDVPNTPATKFRLGSITKQFTAASILLLEERGKLKLDDPIKTHMPDAPAAWDTDHDPQSADAQLGDPELHQPPGLYIAQARRHAGREGNPTVRDKPLDFVPGEKMSYSNSGYLVLGYVIERVAGVSYEKFVTDNIFVPLGMKDSGYDSNSAIIARRAAGLRAVAGRAGQRRVHSHECPARRPVALYSTTGDLLRWEQGLFSGTLISAASLAKDDHAVQERLRIRRHRADRQAAGK